MLVGIGLVGLVLFGAQKYLFNREFRAGLYGLAWLSDAQRADRGQFRFETEPGGPTPKSGRCRETSARAASSA